MKRLKIAVIANSAWYVYNFRRPLMRALADDGNDVAVIAPHDAYADRLSSDGWQWHQLPLNASGTNPLRELRTVAALRSILAQGAFDLAFTYTPKANIYTGLAAYGLPLQHVPNVSGLGRAFIERTALTSLVLLLYRFAFRRARHVVFQNDDDRQVFVDAGLVGEERTVRVPGSGVDLDRFQPTPLPLTRPVQFLYIGRLLGDKGVIELIEAARLLRKRGALFQLRILGSADAINPTAIGRETVAQWVSEGLVLHEDHLDDVRPFIQAAHAVVLPSYREGVPRVLLEAAAMGRPCIATDVPGCRDAVIAGQSGLLCAARNATALAEVMQSFLNMPASEWESMGQAGRALVEKKFGEQRVLDEYRRMSRRLKAVGS